MVYTVKNGIFPSNTYIVADEGSRHCLLIDPGLDVESIEKGLAELHLHPAHILATHGHFDHVGSVGYFQKKYGAIFYIHRRDEKILKSVNFFLKIMKIDMRVDVPVPDYIFQETNEILLLNNTSVEVYNMEGHTDGSCLFRMGGCLFTGDTLYAKGIGVNPFPGQDKIKLRASLKQIVRTFPEETIIYPGHGGSETLGTIKSSNTELNQFLIINQAYE